jgi:hypothetical protein
MEVFQSVELWLVALVFTIIVVGGFGVFARWCSLSPAVRREQLEKLRVGMTSAEVVAIIGQPREFKQMSNGQRQWVYGSPMKRHMLLVEFSAHDRMLSFAHGVPGARRQRNPFPDA